MHKGAMGHLGRGGSQVRQRELMPVPSQGSLSSRGGGGHTQQSTKKLCVGVTA